MFTSERHPGKYEANRSRLLAQIVHQATMDGCDAEAGDVDQDGRWIGLVLGRRYGFTVTEDDQGFVTVEAFKSHAEARTSFEARHAAIEA